jgi:hypothetical protein
MAQMRFQPRLGRFLAAAAENVVSILDVETQACRYSLKVGSNRNLEVFLLDLGTSMTFQMILDLLRIYIDYLYDINYQSNSEFCKI